MEDRAEQEIKRQTDRQIGKQTETVKESDINDMEIQKYEQLKDKQDFALYIYIYIYVCVCVCIGREIEQLKDKEIHRHNYKQTENLGEVKARDKKEVVRACSKLEMERKHASNIDGNVINTFSTHTIFVYP